MLAIRKFLKESAGAGRVLEGLFLRLMPAWGSASGAPPATQASESRFEGFLLLPADAPPPSLVMEADADSASAAVRGAPIFCGVDDEEEEEGQASPINAVSEPLPSLEEIVKQVEFPIYTFGNLPEHLQYTDADLIRYDTGEIYAVSLSFRPQDAETGQKYPFIHEWIVTEFQRPYPMWDTYPEGGETPRAQPVEGLPAPGLMKTTLGGHVFYWIADDVLYTVNVEANLSAEEALNIVSSYREI